MTSQQVCRFASRALLLFLSSAIPAATANAAFIVALVVDPWTTAGTTPDVTSTRSGPGTWHLFAVDDLPGQYGFNTYDVTVTGATSVNHRSPLTTAQDVNGDFQPIGFNIFRTASNGNPIQASENLPGTTPFLIKGFGQEASNFTDKVTAAQPGATVVGPSVSPSWGSYNTIAPVNGKHWLFIAEGTYATGSRPGISHASFTAYISPTNYDLVQVLNPTILVIPEPATFALIGVALIGRFAFHGRRRSTARPGKSQLK